MDPYKLVLISKLQDYEFTDLLHIFIQQMHIQTNNVENTDKI